MKAGQVTVIVLCVFAGLALACGSGTTDESTPVTVPTDTPTTPTIAPTFPPTWTPTFTPSPPPENTPRPTSTTGPKRTPTPTPRAAPAVLPVILTGSGDSVLDVGQYRAYGKAHFTHDGEHNFIVHAVDSNGKTIDYLINDIGAYDGTVIWNKNAARLEIKADGRWTIELSR